WTVVVTGAFIVAAVPRLPAQQARGARRARRSAVASNPLSRGAGGAARGVARAQQARVATGAEHRLARVQAAPGAAVRGEPWTMARAGSRRDDADARQRPRRACDLTSQGGAEPVGGAHFAASVPKVSPCHTPPPRAPPRRIAGPRYQKPST